MKQACKTTVHTFALFFLWLVVAACGSDDNDDGSKAVPERPVDINEFSVDGVFNGYTHYDITGNKPAISVSFSTRINPSSVSEAIRLTDKNNNRLGLTVTYSNDSTLLIQPETTLNWLSSYTFTISEKLTGSSGQSFLYPISVTLSTWIDPADKLPRITDDELLTLVQQKTFRYFWDFGHPVSGMARERTTSGDVVTTGGTGFGIMAMLVASERNFVTRTQALERVQTIASFLKDKCTTYHGAFPHWVNGQTGETMPFSAKDNGGDLVETSLLFQGLLTARQYFSAGNAAETALRQDINDLWEAVEWNWYLNNGNTLFWHWSPDYAWEVNLPVRGWNESLITYLLAAASPSHSISKTAYDTGWAKNGEMKNGGTYYGHTLPLGEAYGGPLFFAHYSFLGLNPKGLSDIYANYWDQCRAHTLINYQHGVLDVNKNGYSEDCWGLTASDGDTGYSAHSPTNDKGVIAPTAALSSMPYTPEESMKALRFFYYKLGDRLWSDYGFYDSFNLKKAWFNNQHIAIDQGPIILMIENHRTGLLWNLFMSAPEIKAGLKKLGFETQ